MDMDLDWNSRVLCVHRYSFGVSQLELHYMGVSDNTYDMILFQTVSPVADSWWCAYFVIIGGNFFTTIGR